MVRILALQARGRCSIHRYGIYFTLLTYLFIISLFDYLGFLAMRRDFFQRDELITSLSHLLLLYGFYQITS